jgi:plastocyanin domain-containing protein
MNKNNVILLGIIVVVVSLIMIRNMSANSVLPRSNNLDNPIKSADQIINLGLSGGNYNPRTINLEYGKPVTFRNDGSLRGCALYFNQPELGINTNFAKTPEFTFTPYKKGAFTGACSMGMYRTTINVV